MLQNSIETVEVLGSSAQSPLLPSAAQGGSQGPRDLQTLGATHGEGWEEGGGGKALNFIQSQASVHRMPAAIFKGS